MEITKFSILKMHHLEQREENEEEILIGRMDISNFIILPAFGVEIIRLLDSGRTIGQVEEEMEKRFGEPVDVLSFAQDLITEYRFVYLLDGAVVNEKVEIKDHFPWITQKMGDFFFNRAAYSIYLLVCLSGLGVLVSTGKYFPNYADIFLSTSVTLSLATALLAGWFFVFIHELAHLLGARSVGIGSRIGFNHRLFFPVAETRMSNIVLVPPNKRYRAYFAGMAWDGCFWSIGIWLLFAADLGAIQVSNSMISYIKFLNLIFLQNMAFQFMFFMKTDVYYAFTTAFRCNNLLENTTLYLRSFFRKHTEAERDEWETISLQEKKIVYGYAIFYGLGLLWSAYFFVAYIARQTIDFMVHIWTGFAENPVYSGVFLDRLLITLLLAFPFGILLWSWARSWRKKQQHVSANGE